MSVPSYTSQPHTDEPRYSHPLRRAIDRADWAIGKALTKRRRLGYAISGTVVGNLAKVVFGLRVRGKQNIPREGGLLIVCNHLSNLDPPLTGSFFPREIHFAAKIELFEGVGGSWIRYHNSIPIRRGSGSDKDALKRMVGLLKRGGALLMFPEGTRAKDPEKGRDAKAGAGMVAALAKPMIIPAHLTGTHNPKAALFKPGGMTLTFGEPKPYEEWLALAKSRLPEDAPKKELYKTLSDVLMEHVRAL